ncbi:uncharacterized protein LOC143032842 isoform X2 [Oratosquilla oratoria]
MLLRGTWTKGTSSSTERSSTPRCPSGAPVEGVVGKPGENEAAGPAVPGSGTTTNTGWSMKLWRRGSSQERPLRPSSSQGSENSYTEEPYVNADAQSAVYAELNSVTSSQGVSDYRSCSLNTYSEIPDPLSPVGVVTNTGGVRSYVPEATYENAGYVLSEGGVEHPESSVGSTSTPSSAYYSDVSTTETENNKKKKKKKKNDERNNINLQRSLMPSNISSNVAMINNHISGPERLNKTSIRGVPNPQPPHRHNHELLPLALELLPQHLNLDNRGAGAGVMVGGGGGGVVRGGVLPPLQPNLNNIRTANQIQTLPKNKPSESIHTSSNPLQEGSDGETLSCASPSSAVISPSSFINNNVPLESQDVSQRPLPPLPSRQCHGPQRRGAYVSGTSKVDENLPPIPSEYV